MPSSARALAGPSVRTHGLLRSAGRAIAVNPLVALAGAVLVAMLLIAVFAPYLGTIDPLKVWPSAKRTVSPGLSFWLFTRSMLFQADVMASPEAESEPLLLT